jgi:ATP-dependent DNA helicase PIF1
MISLTTEQQEAYDAILKGESLFLTGPGGVGKSFLLKKVYDDYTAKTGRRIAVTAMTGCAANLLGTHAKTLHSWSGIGFGKGPTAALIDRVRNFFPARKKWSQAGCLIIDEVSMMTPQLLDALDLIGQAIRRNTKPFGGIQIVLVGDFYQLPPIARLEEGLQFAFQANVWSRAITRTCELTTILRQREPAFHKILTEARAGTLSAESLAILESRRGLSWKGKARSSHGSAPNCLQAVRPTMCFTKKADVAAINDRYLARLIGDRHVYEASSPASKVPRASLEKIIDRMDREYQYETRLELVAGCQVMLIVNRNPEEGLVNGSRGVVTGFSGAGWPMVKFLNGPLEPIEIEAHVWESEDSTPVKRSQVPLKIAYAITIHKAQGASLDCALVDIGKATFEYGQAYVALSRVRSLDALYVYDLDPSAFRAHPLVQAFYRGAAAAAAAAVPAEGRITAYFGPEAPLEITDD